MLSADAIEPASMSKRTKPTAKPASEKGSAAAEVVPAIRRAAARAEARMRLARVLWALPTSLTLALGVSAVALVARKVAPVYVPESWVLAVLIGAGISVLGTVIFAASKKLPPRAGALALDLHHALRGRLTNALEFTEVDPDARTPLMEAAIEDAGDAAGDLDPRKAVHIALPPELGVSAAVGLAVVAVALLEVPVRREVPPPPKVAAIDPLDVAPDDLELFRDAIDQLKREDQSPEVQEAIERFNQLVTDIAERRLNRTEAFRRMQEIENDLLKGAEADRKALEEALKETAKELEKSIMSKPVANAMKKSDMKAAEQEMKKLAEQLRDKKNKPNKAELEKLRRALDRAAKNKKKALEQLNERRAEMRQDLLKNKKKKEQAKNKKERDEQERLLKKKKRELERLDREAERRERALRRLSKLDRDLAKAAADLARDLGLSAEDLEQVAEDLNRLDQEQMSDKEKEQLRRRLEELRELIRQQQQGGKKMRQRLKRFLRRARGGRAQQGQGQGQQGQGQQGQGQQGQGQQGQGQQGQGQQPGQGQGQGQGQGPVVLGPGGKPIPVDMPGAGSGQGDQPGGQGSGEGGKEFGSGSGGDPKGESTDIDGKNVDVRAEAVDSGAGPTRAEVILSAADRGFTGKPYQKVYKQYRTVAEDQLDKEEIPDGMRFYVRRYFQLIRPRE
jgi:hypothetical protein